MRVGIYDHFGNSAQIASDPFVMSGPRWRVGLELPTERLLEAGALPEAHIPAWVPRADPRCWTAGG